MTKSLWKAIGLTFAVIGIVLFTSLGIWQLYRLEWKRNLIAQVEQQQIAAPVSAPPVAQWNELIAYQRVFAHGQWIQGKDTHVLAVTARGRGYWILSPLQADDGFIILINRGFVPTDKVSSVEVLPLENGPVLVHGLLRLSEPSYAFLRHNDPANDRWYGRDVEGIAAKYDLSPVAPYFIDADDAAVPHVYPIGGLTVIKFRNSHLVYALTWFALAIGLAGAVIYNSRSGKQ